MGARRSSVTLIVWPARVVDNVPWCGASMGMYDSLPIPPLFPVGIHGYLRWNGRLQPHHRLVRRKAWPHGVGKDPFYGTPAVSAPWPHGLFFGIAVSILQYKLMQLSPSPLSRPFSRMGGL